MIKKILLILPLLLISCSSQIDSINKTSDGVAIKGYDPVAYFTQGHPVQGTEDFQYEWKNAKWLFSNMGHLQLFKSNPEKYMPQYGGY